MNLPRYIFLILIIQTQQILARGPYNNYAPQSSYPYISGDTLRMYCDFATDRGEYFNPKDVTPTRNIIFVKGDLLEEFFTEYHTNIPCPYILVTHNSDGSTPAAFGSYLNDAKIIAWFGQNMDIAYHPKLFPIPIGIANRAWAHGDPHALQRTRSKLPAIKSNDKLLYMNFAIGNNPKERQPVYDYFKTKSFCTVESPQSFEGYLNNMAQFKFVVSPPGNGLDCHRVWEALLVGCVPVVKTSTLDALYKDLPILIINNWEQITEQFLLEHYEVITSQHYNLEPLFVDYWVNKIKQTRLQ